MGAFDAWIGRSETRADQVDADRITGFHAVLDRDCPTPAVLPLLGHWLMFRPIVRQSDIDIDGHPKRGGAALLPPIALPRRMWAGSRVEFIRPIPLGARLERRTTIASIEEKHGRSGTMVFVGLVHSIEHDGILAIREQQDIVYREAAGAGVVPTAVDASPRAAASSRMVTADPVMLFRYSALTLNGHRIHYDRDHAVNVEGYRGLVVHGPLAATLLLDHFCAAKGANALRHFAFRARAPLFDSEAFRLCSDGPDLWIEDSRGATAMTATVS
jgi:3-methylfumaryl-CoA hydratase